MADSVCTECDAPFKRCGACTNDYSTVCNKCKRMKIVEKQRDELEDGKALVFIGDNLAGVYTIEQAKQVIKFIPNGRLELKGEKSV